MQSVVDAYDQPFAIVDRAYRVVVVNRAFEEAYGVERASAVGRLCYSLVPTGNRPCPCAIQGDDCPFPSVFAGEGGRTVAKGYRDGDGNEHLVRVHAYPIRTRSGEVYVGELVERDAVDPHPRVDEDRSLPGMVGSTPAFRELLDRLLMAAHSAAPVLLQGETGTGKELAAAHLHRLSERRGGPFQVLDCTTLSDALFESEVFGHERGAFTGSVGERQGLFELADGGTLFIDEIGEMPPGQQAKLLRVLESGEFRRVGGTRTRRADVRLVCATNRELRGSPRFRQDLYYRIACVAITLPTLRERRADIEPLSQVLIGRIGRAAGRRYVLEPSALEVLAGYDYPGNVRELRNILWVASINAGQDRICARHVAAALPTDRYASGLACPTPGPAPCPPGKCRAQAMPLPPEEAPLSHWEAGRLASVLLRHRGNRRAAAEELGVSERTVYRKIRRYGLS